MFIKNKQQKAFYNKHGKNDILGDIQNKKN